MFSNIGVHFHKTVPLNATKIIIFCKLDTFHGRDARMGVSRGVKPTSGVTRRLVAGATAHPTQYIQKVSRGVRPTSGVTRRLVAGATGTAHPTQSMHSE